MPGVFKSSGLNNPLELIFAEDASIIQGWGQ